jgi:hypothetical protein
VGQAQRQQVCDGKDSANVAVCDACSRTTKQTVAEKLLHQSVKRGADASHAMRDHGVNPENAKHDVVR